VTEELKNPSVNLPRAIIIGIPLVMISYLAVNVAYLTVLSPTELINSKAVAVVILKSWVKLRIIRLMILLSFIKDVGNQFLGPMAFIIPVSVVISTFGGIVSRGFAMGRYT